MKLREVIIKNYRCLVDVSIPISDDTIILVGENNSGKTALLDALRVILPRTTSGRVNPFEEYDYHMAATNDSPETSDGIIIEVWFREDETDEWPGSLTQSLDNIIQTDPFKDIDSIGLRLSSKYDQNTNEMASKW